MRDQLINIDGGAETQSSQTAALGKPSAPSPSLTDAAACRWPDCRVGRRGVEFAKSLFVCGFDFWKTQLSPTQLGSMQEYPETHAPENITHYCWNQGWFLFLSVWWSVSCRAVWVLGREKKLKQEVYRYIVASGQHVVLSTEYAVQWFNLVCQQ